MKTIKGLPIVNATLPIYLVITSEDIANGIRKDPTSCAAAVAFKRQHRVTEILMHRSRAYIKYDYMDAWVRGAVPKSLSNEQIVFDRGGDFQPGTYVFSPLLESKRPKGKRQGGNTEPSTEGKTKRVRRVLEGVRSEAGFD